MPFENSKAVLETLKNTVFFKDLGENDLHAVADLMEPVTFKKNDTVMKEGDNDASCYIVLQGAVQVYKSTPEKEQVLLMKLGQGDFVGLGALVDHAPHNATVKAAVEPTILLRLSSVAFETLLEKSPVVAKALLKYFAKELRSFRSRLVDVRGRSSEKGSNLIVFFDSKPYEKPYLEKHLKKQSDLDLEVKYFEVKLNKDTVQLAAGAKAVCIFVNDKCDADVLAQLSDIGVELVLLRCAGFNNVDIKAASALGISVARVPKYSPYAVAEHAVALIQSLNRKTTLAYTRVKSGNFALNGLVGFDLHGKTVGVIGTGKIGQIFIDIMLGFGCKVLCYDKFINKDVEKLPNVKYTDLNTVFRSCTIFSIHCPLTDETKHMINKETIELMPKGAMLINTSRGALVDSAALVHGLKSKHLGAAGLDVYEEEAEYFFEDKSASVITDDILARLLSFPNVLITAHQAFLTEEALEAIAQVTTQNLQELLVGKKKMKEMTNTVLE